MLALRSTAAPPAAPPASARSVRRVPARAVVLLVVVLGAIVLTLSHHSPHGPLAARSALRAALRDPRTSHVLSHVHWSSASASPVDDQLERVSFFVHARIVAEVAVNHAGAVTQSVDFTRLHVPYGDWLAYQPALLLGLGALFVLMAGVAPLRRVRNLDVAVALSLVLPVVILEDRLLGASVLVAVPPLLYLMSRCAWVGIGRARAPAPSTPLFLLLTRRLHPRERVRVLRILIITLALIFVMVGVSSANAVDVTYAVMEGATGLLHGVLPYGHLPGDVIHGDTYPLLSYALYVPLAFFTPVRTAWDSVDGALAVAVLAALATAYALLRAAGANISRARSGRSLDAQTAGLRAAVTWLAFPPLLITVSTGTTDVVLAAMLVFAVVLWRAPTASCGLIAAAGWFKLAPFALLPVWLAPLRGRRLLAACAAAGAVSAAMLALLIALGGIDGPPAMIHALAYQFSRGSPQSAWAVLGIQGLQPLGQACVLGLVCAAVLQLRRDGELAADPRRMAAIAAAILIGLQLAADYWAFLYLVWVVPLFGLSLLADGVPTAEPIEIGAERVGSTPRLVPVNGARA